MPSGVPAFSVGHRAGGHRRSGGLCDGLSWDCGADLNTSPAMIDQTVKAAWEYLQEHLDAAENALSSRLPDRFVI